MRRPYAKRLTPASAMIDTLEHAPTLTEQIAAGFERRARSNGRPDALRDLRARAAAAFERLGIPTRKNEAWKYTNVERALRHDYALLDPGPAAAVSAAEVADLRIPGFDAALLVVVNGVVVPELSDTEALPEGVRIGGLRDALQSDASLADHFGQYADLEDDAFVALNTALDPDGVFL